MVDKHGRGQNVGQTEEGKMGGRMRGQAWKGRLR